MEPEESGFVVNGESTEIFTNGRFHLDIMKMQKEAFAPWIELITTETIRQKIADSLP